MTATTAMHAALNVPSKKPTVSPIQNIAVTLSEQLSVDPASVVGTAVVGVVVANVVVTVVVGTFVVAAGVVAATVAGVVVPTIWQVT